jgi:hypothetical protein
VEALAEHSRHSTACCHITQARQHLCAIKHGCHAEDNRLHAPSAPSAAAAAFSMQFHLIVSLAPTHAMCKCCCCWCSINVSHGGHKPGGFLSRAVGGSGSFAAQLTSPTGGSSSSSSGSGSSSKVGVTCTVAASCSVLPRGNRRVLGTHVHEFVCEGSTGYLCHAGRRCGSALPLVQRVIAWLQLHCANLQPSLHVSGSVAEVAEAPRQTLRTVFQTQPSGKVPDAYKQSAEM